MADPMADITVVIPTLDRPASLARAMASVLRLQEAAALVDAIVIADNSPAASARPTVAAIAAGSVVQITYVHAPKPGVATARNAALAVVSAPFVAFLDDDEEAAPGWLSSLFTVHRDTGADVTFGPVQGVADAAEPWARAYLDAFFSRTGPASSGLTDAVHGCGNSMMTRATALAGPAPFDVAADHTGGEDDRLFARLKAGGARFAWAADAVVLEHAPDHRATVRYALARALGYGQTPGQIAARSGDWPGVARWMIIGAAQTLLFGAGALILAVPAPTHALTLADKAARGLGKVLWFLTLDFYGRASTTGAASLSPMATKNVQRKSL